MYRDTFFGVSRQTAAQKKAVLENVFFGVLLMLGCCFNLFFVKTKCHRLVAWSLSVKIEEDISFQHC